MKVIGVGGPGGRIASHLAVSGYEVADFIAVDTDRDDLATNKCTRRIQVGASLVHGLGCCARPNVAMRAIEESRSVLAGTLENADLVIVVAALGGGFGTATAPWLVARSRERGVRTVAVASTPFTFEGRKRWRMANSAVGEITRDADAMWLIAGDDVLGPLPDGLATSYSEAKALLDDALSAGARLFLR